MSELVDVAVTTVLSLQGVVRRYRSGAEALEVLSGVDLTLSPGEIVGLVGPSGSGKSSLLHVAGLLEKPTAGEVYVGGTASSTLSDRDRTRIRRGAIGFVYQFHHLLPEFSALDNVAMPQIIAGKKLREAREEADRLLTMLGLADRISHQPGQLSGGEQQRVAIARALANSPQILLADEPTGNLDPNTSGTVFQSLFDLVRIEGVTALVATHNLDLMRFMDRVYGLKEGKLEQKK
ncbi:MAG: ABC transporter ATP-binding protein [Caulobacterales bacterium]|nr:ABC transporter ATP-binding protein [Caulobacterales bacterium]